MMRWVLARLRGCCGWQTGPRTTGTQRTVNGVGRSQHSATLGLYLPHVGWLQRAATEVIVGGARGGGVTVRCAVLPAQVGDTALVIAVYHGHADLFNLLINSPGVKLNAPDVVGACGGLGCGVPLRHALAPRTP